MTACDFSLKKRVAAATVAAAALVFIASLTATNQRYAMSAKDGVRVTASMLPEVLHDAEPVQHLRIIDGDTIKFRRQFREFRGRLFGIDTPESLVVDGSKKLSQDAAKCGTTEAQMLQLGKYASNALKGLWTSDQYQAAVRVVDKSGKYGREITELFFYTDQKVILVNEWLVSSGYACAYRNNKSYEPFEKLAATRQLGLWETSGEVMSKLCERQQR